MARHIDSILSIKEINAIQWVQGEGENKPDMQWISLIEKIQSAGKSVLVMLQADELRDFISKARPEGIMLSIPSSNEVQELELLKQIKKWTK